jgi:8-amino-7-oxononanoate synthase
MPTKGPTGISPQVRERLIRQGLEQRAHRSGRPVDAWPEPVKSDAAHAASIPEKFYRFDLHPGYQQLRIIHDAAEKLGVSNPYFKMHDGIAGVTTRIGGREFLNFASYNYLGLSGDPRVSRAAKEAIDTYGTSVGASRLVSGERSVHRELERAIADAYAVEDAVVFVSGHATNVNVIGHLFGPKDLILHDALIHNSVLQGIRLSGAHRLPYPHRDWDALDTILTEQRQRFERVLIVIEGIYSMDGDFPDLPHFVELKQRHRALLMVDEAHSFGVMGKTGLGIREHFGLPGRSVDIWMGTLSKALASCGGFIAGETALVEHLKFLSSGFLYSVGMAPAVAAAALAALHCMRAEPQRVANLQQRGRFLRDKARAAGMDVGSCAGLSVVPVFTGSWARAVKLSHALFERGIHVQPILYPAVPEKSARLRFFVNCGHTEEQILETVRALKEEAGRI